MRVTALRGLKTLFSFGPKISQAVADEPDGLLLHEGLIYSLFPPNVGMRQYWRDFDSLERWARSLPHSEWWRNFLRDPGGTGFWHEAYFMRGGMEGMYDALDKPLGMMRFAPVQRARGPMFSARDRARLSVEATVPAPVTEEELYA
jgi:hypothetical protein